MKKSFFGEKRIFLILFFKFRNLELFCDNICMEHLLNIRDVRFFVEFSIKTPFLGIEVFHKPNKTFFLFDI